MYSAQSTQQFESHRVEITDFGSAVSVSSKKWMKQICIAAETHRLDRIAFPIVDEEISLAMAAESGVAPLPAGTIPRWLRFLRELTKLENGSLGLLLEAIRQRKPPLELYVAQTTFESESFPFSLEAWAVFEVDHAKKTVNFREFEWIGTGINGPT